MALLIYKTVESIFQSSMDYYYLVVDVSKLNAVFSTIIVFGRVV